MVEDKTTANPSSANLSRSELTTEEKLFSETALISWLELQRFFAQGKVMWVAKDLDLVVVANLFAKDRTAELAPLLESLQIAAASNDQARRWYDNQEQLWSVVVAPFVLVQEA